MLERTEYKSRRALPGAGCWGKRALSRRLTRRPMRVNGRGEGAASDISKVGRRGWVVQCPDGGVSEPAPPPPFPPRGGGGEAGLNLFLVGLHCIFLCAGVCLTVTDTACPPIKYENISLRNSVGRNRGCPKCTCGFSLLEESHNPTTYP